MVLLIAADRVQSAWIPQGKHFLLPWLHRGSKLQQKYTKKLLLVTRRSSKQRSKQEHITHISFFKLHQLAPEADQPRSMVLCITRTEGVKHRREEEYGDSKGNQR